MMREPIVPRLAPELMELCLAGRRERCSEARRGRIAARLDAALAAGDAAGAGPGDAGAPLASSRLVDATLVVALAMAVAGGLYLAVRHSVGHQAPAVPAPAMPVQGAAGDAATMAAAEPAAAAPVAAEYAALERARLALAAGDAAAALADIGRHQREYPASRYEEEREALRVRALLEAGRDAVEEARRFVARYPRSIYRHQFESVLQRHR